MISSRVFEYLKPFVVGRLAGGGTTARSCNSAVAGTLIETYLCPSVSVLSIEGFAASHYAGNGGTLVDGTDGIFYPLSSVGLEQIPDGSSMTIVAGEICEFFGGWAGGSMSILEPDSYVTAQTNPNGPTFAAASAKCITPSATAARKWRSS